MITFTISNEQYFYQWKFPRPTFIKINILQKFLQFSLSLRSFSGNIPKNICPLETGMCIYSTKWFLIIGQVICSSFLCWERSTNILGIGLYVTFSLEDGVLFLQKHSSNKFRHAPPSSFLEPAFTRDYCFGTFMLECR